jgi:hypothetical protein
MSHNRFPNVVLLIVLLLIAMLFDFVHIRPISSAFVNPTTRVVFG